MPKKSKKVKITPGGKASIPERKTNPRDALIGKLSKNYTFKSKNKDGANLERTYRDGTKVYKDGARTIIDGTGTKSGKEKKKSSKKS